MNAVAEVIVAVALARAVGRVYGTDAAAPQATLFDRPLPDPTRDIAGGLHREAGDTERAAAELVAPRSGTWRWRVLLAVARAGASGRTDWELHTELGGLLYTVAPRRHELARDGWIEDSGKRRRTPSGTEAVVWVLSPAGLVGVLEKALWVKAGTP